MTNTSVDHLESPHTIEDNSKKSSRLRADSIKPFRCKNLIAVMERPVDVRNIGTIIRNANAFGVDKVYIVDPTKKNL